MPELNEGPSHVMENEIDVFLHLNSEILLAFRNLQEVN